jgi:hypothetical protein
MTDTDDQLALRRACREVLLEQTDSARRRKAAESAAGHDEQLWLLIGELGWAALGVPADYDGLAGSVADLGIVAEELGRALQSGPLLPTLAASYVLGRYGDDRLRSELLPAVAGAAPCCRGPRRNPNRLLRTAWSSPPSWQAGIDVRWQAVCRSSRTATSPPTSLSRHSTTVRRCSPSCGSGPTDCISAGSTLWTSPVATCS